MVGVCDVSGGVVDPDGLDVAALLRWQRRARLPPASPGGEPVGRKELLETPCDVLVPAALERQITAENAARLNCELVVEAANGPTTPEADAILGRARHLVVPDMLANARRRDGLATSSGSRTIQRYAWSPEEMVPEARAAARARPSTAWSTPAKRLGVDLRTAAQAVAIERVAEASRLRSVLPLGGETRPRCDLGPPNGWSDQRSTSSMARSRGSGPRGGYRQELLNAGSRPSRFERRVERGHLLPVHPGVYRVGHRAPSVEATYMAAVEAHGPGAVLSGRAAGWLLRLLKGRPPRPEVTSPRQRRVCGVTSRRSTGWTNNLPRNPRDDRPVDTRGPGRGPAEAELARACNEAGVLHATTPRQVEAALALRPRAKGAATLKRVLFGEIPVTLSALEKRFLRCSRSTGFRCR